jgi:hypothetical protein
MARREVVKASDCSAEDLLRLSKRAGFVAKTGGKHWKITTAKGQFVTTISHHSRLNRELVKGIVDRLREFGAAIEIR